jgi:hypothetical protein
LRIKVWTHDGYQGSCPTSKGQIFKLAGGKSRDGRHPQRHVVTNNFHCPYERSSLCMEVLVLSFQSSSQHTCLILLLSTHKPISETRRPSRTARQQFCFTPFCPPPNMLHFHSPHPRANTSASPSAARFKRRKSTFPNKSFQEVNSRGEINLCTRCPRPHHHGNRWHFAKHIGIGRCLPLYDHTCDWICAPIYLHNIKFYIIAVTGLSIYQTSQFG